MRSIRRLVGVPFLTVFLCGIQPELTFAQDRFHLAIAGGVAHATPLACDECAPVDDAPFNGLWLRADFGKNIGRFGVDLRRWEIQDTTRVNVTLSVQIGLPRNKRLSVYADIYSGLAITKALESEMYGLVSGAGAGVDLRLAKSLFVSFQFDAQLRAWTPGHRWYRMPQLGLTWRL